MQSCSSDEDYDSISPISTKMDMLVASDEFQQFSIASQGLADKFISNYSNLSDAERSRVLDLLKELSENSTTNNTEIMEKYTEFSNIIGIDYTDISSLKSHLNN